MNKELNLFAKIVLRENYGEFEKLLSKFETSDKKEFVRLHKKMFERAEFDTEEYDDIDEQLLFQSFAIQVKRMFFVDWSGEEYVGQVKRSISIMLKHFGENLFKWNTKKFESTLDFSVIKRGEYIPLLFSAMDKQLEKLDYQIVIFDELSDRYCYSLLPKSDMQLVNGIQTAYFNIINTKIYTLYLTDRGSESGKILLYLKNKFAIPLNEIKTFAAQPEILITRGNIVTVSKEKAEIEKIGGKVRIDEE